MLASSANVSQKVSSRVDLKEDAEKRRKHDVKYVRIEKFEKNIGKILMCRSDATLETSP
jgi:hypothetical protein